MDKYTVDDGPSDRLVIRMEPVGPIEVSDLTRSFASLARFYDRHYRHGGEPAPRLYITKLETGSIIAEIAPFILFLGATVSTMDTALIVSDFTRRLTKGVRAFSDPSASGSDTAPSRDDASDLREFIKPLTGRKGASLGIKHARYHSRDAERETMVEYVFDEAELNRATINIEHALVDDPEEDVWPTLTEDSNIVREVALVFEQASRKPGKEKGRTGDKAIVSSISSKALPVYFRKSFQDLKDKMILGEINPLTDCVFIVDVYVTKVAGDPKAYIVTDVHSVLPIGNN